MAKKAPDAFRTISEVSEWLDTPAHVLRFWESKFTQIKPVKRAGGRRYYRPDDMALLGGIKCLLHEDGMTIKGAQKLLREKGVRHVASLSPDVDGHSVAADIVPEISIETKSIEPVLDVTPPPVPDPVTDQGDPPSHVPPAPARPITAMPPPTLPDPPQAPKVVAGLSLAPDAPQPPEPSEPRPGVLGLIETATPVQLRSQTSQILPLLARLEGLRDRMRAG